MPIKLLKSDIKDKIDNPAPGYMILGFDERGQLVWKDEDGAYGTIVPSVAIGNYEILEIGNYLTVGFRYMDTTTYPYGLYSIAQGNDVAASGLSSYAQGTDAIAQGDYSTAKGEMVEASGKYSYVSGVGQLVNNKLTSGGLNSFVHSYSHDFSEDSGTWSNFSVILGGQNHIITGDTVSHSSDNSFILGGANNYIGTGATNSGIIGGHDNEIDNDVEHTVIIGGSYIDATVDNAVYVPRMAFRTGTYSTPPNVTEYGTIQYQENPATGKQEFYMYSESTPSGSLMAGVYASTLDPDLEMLNPLGGYPTNTTVGSLTGRTLVQMWDKLLFPTIYPTYVEPPTNSLSHNISPAYVIIGTTPNITFTISFNRGQILLNGAFQAYRSGTVVTNGYTFTGPGLTTSQSSNVYNLTTYTMEIGYRDWISTTAYNTGPQPKDSTDTPYGTSWPAGTTASSVVSRIEGVYPLFATTSSISNPDTQQPLISMKTATGNATVNTTQLNLATESGGYRQSFDIPTNWTGAPTSRPLINVWTYSPPPLDTWGATGLGQWTTSLVSHTIAGISINYTRYTFNGTVRGNTNIRLQF